MLAVSRFIQSRLQRRLLLLFVPLVIIPLLLIGYFLTQSYLTLFTRILEDVEISRVETLVSRANDLLTPATDDINYLARVDGSTSDILQTAASPSFNGQDPAYIKAGQELLGLIDVQRAYTSLKVINLAGQEVFRVDRPIEAGAAEIVPQSRLVSRVDESYVKEIATLPSGSLYLAPVHIDDSSTSLPNAQISRIPVMHYASSVIDQDTKQVSGLVVLTVNVQPLFDLFLSDPKNVRDGIIVFDQTGQLLVDTYHPEQALLSAVGEAGKTPGKAVDVLGQLTFTQLLASTGVALHDPININGVDRFPVVGHFVPANVSNPSGLYIAEFREQNRLSAGGAFGQIVLESILAIIVTILIVGFLASLIARQITNPLELLSQRVVGLQRGQMALPLEPIIAQRRDEIGTLGRTFETMANDLNRTMTSMESQIEARTADLNTAADIASAANQVRDVNELISLTVNLIRDRFNFYYVQAYLVDDQQQAAVLREGTGYVGRRLMTLRHSIPLSARSLVTRAIQTGEQQVVQNTAFDKDFRPNEMLPETRAELVVPLKTKKKVIGVLDIQHNAANAFDPDSLRLFQTLAEQIAITLENVELYQSTNENVSRLGAVTRNFPNGVVLMFDKTYR